MKVSQRDIVLINFPFSDLTAAKVRPALVISSDQYNAVSLDAVVLAITSNLSPSEYKVPVENSDLENGRLPVSSAIRVDKPFSVLQSKVIKIQGKVGKPKLEQVRAVLTKLTE